jgi:hypothetical protein
VADVWCWFVLREEYCWLVAGGWFVVREKYCWLVADKPNEQGGTSSTNKLSHPLIFFHKYSSIFPYLHMFFASQVIIALQVISHTVSVSPKYL